MRLPTSDLTEILRSMQPIINSGVYAYVLVPDGYDVGELCPIVTVREREGLTAVLEESVAQRAGLEIVFRTAWITLNVHSDLQAVGLTAAFSTVLTEANISCNVVAGVFHDHMFVPLEQVDSAIKVLQALQASAASRK